MTLEAAAVTYPEDRERSERPEREALRSALAEVAAARSAGLHLPDRQAGDDAWAHAALFEQLGRQSLAGIALSFLVHAGMVLPLLDRHGSAEVRERFLGPGTAGDAVFSHSLRELIPGIYNRARVTARRQTGAYVLDGTTAYVVNAAVADAHFVLAHLWDSSSPAETVLLMVPAELPGVEVGGPLGGLGGSASPVAAELRFDGIRVPAACRVGVEGTGSAHRERQLDVTRLLAACSAAAAADHCLQLAREHSRTRMSFGTTLDGHQGVRLRLAELRTGIEASRRLNDAAVHTWATGGDGGLLSVAAGLKARRLIRRVVEECLTLHGASGYMEAHPAARFVSEARLFSTATGSDHAMLATLARRAGLDRR